LRTSSRELKSLTSLFNFFAQEDSFLHPQANL
jgi:hypothetical protein